MLCVLLRKDFFYLSFTLYLQHPAQCLVKSTKKYLLSWIGNKQTNKQINTTTRFEFQLCHPSAVDMDKLFLFSTSKLHFPYFWHGDDNTNVQVLCQMPLTMEILNYCNSLSSNSLPRLLSCCLAALSINLLLFVQWKVDPYNFYQLAIFLTSGSIENTL